MRMNTAVWGMSISVLVCWFGMAIDSVLLAALGGIGFMGVFGPYFIRACVLGYDPLDPKNKDNPPERVRDDTDPAVAAMMNERIRAQEGKPAFSPTIKQMGQNLGLVPKDPK